MIMSSWQFWAFLSAIFAALTAIFAKIGVHGVNSDFATLVRTVVIFAALCMFLTFSGQWQHPNVISPSSWIFLILSGLATGASWLFYFRALQCGDVARVAPIDKLSVIFVAIFGVSFLGERLSLLNWLGVFLVGAGVVMLSFR